LVAAGLFVASPVWAEQAATQPVALQLASAQSTGASKESLGAADPIAASDTSDVMTSADAVPADQAAPVEGTIEQATDPATTIRNAAPLPYSIVLNGRDVGESILLRLEDGRLLARASEFQRWRLVQPLGTPFQLDGEAYFPLDAMPGFTAEIKPETLSAELNFDPSAFYLTRRSTNRREFTRAQPSQGLGSFLNYDFVATQTTGQGDSTSSLGGALEGVVFNRYGSFNSTWVGSNLMSDGTAAERRIVRLDSAFTHDDQERMTRLVLGDTTGIASILGRPARFGGVRYSRNFATQPGYIASPQLLLGGDAALPSVLEVYLNGVRSESVKIPAGPFQVDAVPISNGLGDVQLVVRDILGREQVISESYYTGARQLGKGIQDFSYEAGVLREALGQKDFQYGDAIAIGTHRYGFSNQFTGEARLELRDDKLQNLSLGGVYANTFLGALTAGIAASESDFGSGLQGTVRYNRSFSRRFGFGLQWTGANAEYRTAATLDNPSPVRQFSASTRLPLGSWGGIGLAYFNVQTREPDRLTEFATANYNTRWRRVSINFIATNRFKPTQDLQFSVRGGLAFGGKHFATAGTSYKIDANDNTGGSTFARVQSSTPRNIGAGYSVELRESHGNDRSGLQTIAGANYAGEYGAVAFAVNHRSGQTSLRESLSGSVGAFAHHLFASRRISSSFAVLDTGIPNLDLQLQGQATGSTNDDGRAVLPSLEAYYRNRIQVDPTNLPMNIDINYDTIDAVPYFRSGVLLALPMRIQQSATLKVMRANGKPLPSGAMVRSADRSFLVGRNGLVYVTDLAPGPHSLSAEWRDGRCTISFDLPAQAGFQPEIGPLDCVEARP